MSHNEILKSLDELNKVYHDKSKATQEIAKYNNEIEEIISTICSNITQLESADNGILDKHFSYRGSNSLIINRLGKEHIQIKSFIKFIKEYIALEQPDIKLLNHLNSALKSFLKNNSDIDKKIEQQIKEKAASEATELKSRNCESFRNAQIINNQLADVIKKRKIRTLCHFTSIYNLSSIIDEGIVPSDTLYEQGKSFRYNDSERWDDMRNCSCVSIEFPNIWYLRKLINETSGDWVILRLSADLLFEQQNYYAEHNAATYSVKQHIEEKITPQHFEALFDDTISICMANGEHKVFKREGLKPYLPTSDQAEILVKGIIHPKFIKEVIFRSQGSMNRYKSFINSRGINCSVDPSLFTEYRNKFRWEAR